MAKILNTTVRPYNLSTYFTDVNKVLRNRPIQFIPGVAKEVSADELKSLKGQKGFKRFVASGYLKVVGDSAPAKDEESDEVNISDAARKLAEDNGINIEDLTPNDKGNITIDIVREAVEASEEKSEDL